MMVDMPSNKETKQNKTIKIMASVSQFYKMRNLILDLSSGLGKVVWMTSSYSYRRSPLFLTPLLSKERKSGLHITTKVARMTLNTLDYLKDSSFWSYLPNPSARAGYDTRSIFFKVEFSRFEFRVFLLLD